MRQEHARYSHESYDIVDMTHAPDEQRVGLVNSLVSDPENDQPFFVVDVGDVLYKVKLFRLKMPRVMPYYAVKCNNTPVLLELLAGLGLGFDCASKAEIETVRPLLSAEDAHSRIIYANPCKTKSFIRHARQTGVEMMTFDNEDELRKVKELHPNARLVLRIKVDDSGSLMSFGVKFGASLDNVPRLLKVAKNLGLNIMGVSFHVGSGCQQPETFHGAIRDARSVFDQARALGFNMSLLDIGGGFPGNKGCQILFDRISQVVNGALAEFFPDENSVKVIAEPGRFMVASAFTLYTTVIAKREQPGNIMYYINDGVYGSFNCKVFDHHAPQPIPLKAVADHEQTFKSSLWGPTCDSIDLICEQVELPHLDVGSWLLFEDMGAYTLCAASNFNGFSKPQLKFVLSYATALYLQKLPFWERLVEHFGEAYHEQQEEEERESDPTSCAVQANANPTNPSNYLVEQHI